MLRTGQRVDWRSSRALQESGNDCASALQAESYLCNSVSTEQESNGRSDRGRMSIWERAPQREGHSARRRRQRRASTDYTVAVRALVSADHRLCLGRPLRTCPQRITLQ